MHIHTSTPTYIHTRTKRAEFILIAPRNGSCIPERSLRVDDYVSSRSTSSGGRL